jgi:branched-chain amino acid transport system ATP-binding protein
MTSPKPILSLTGLGASYGLIPALDDVSLAVGESEAIAVLGSNGAGKSTLSRTIAGLVPATRGSVVLDGEDITNCSPDVVRRRGVCLLPEGRGIFPSLTVMENLRMGARLVPRAERPQRLHRAVEMFPILGKRSSQLAGSLSGGEQQMLSLARVVVAPTRLIIADELSLGLAPKVVDSVFENLQKIRDQGIAIILIEQFVLRALAFSDRCVVLHRGRVGWAGAASDAHEEVLQRYLGQGREAENAQPGSSTPTAPDAGSA